MNAHQLDADGVIINTIVVDSLDVFPNLIDASIGGSVGDRILDVSIVPISAETITARKEAALAARWELIKAERDGPRTEAGVQVGTNWFHTNTDSRIKWLGLKDSARDMLAAGAALTDLVLVEGGTVPWKTMTGDFVPVTVRLALDVVEAVKVLDKQLFRRAEEHYAAMRVSDDAGSYDYSTGWPEIYVAAP